MYFMDKLLSNNQFRSDVMEGKDIPLINMIDNNTKISENVFATLATTSVSTPIIQQLLATNFVQVNTSIVSSFKLREIIEPPTTELSVKQVWDNTLSFMYYHGMLTFSEEDNSFCKTLLIPNEIAQKQYFYELENIVSLTQNDMILRYKHPSVDIVKKILENIIGERYIHYDNSFSEGALQHAIYCVLQAYYKHGNSYFQVKTESGINEQHFSENQKVDNDFDKRTDIILESDKDVIIFELKRISPNGLTWNDKQLKYVLKQRTKSKSKILIEQYRRTMFDVLSGKWKRPKTVERINEGLSELFENELLNLPLNETYLFGTDKEEMKIVSHVVEKAKTQLSDYVKLLKENKKFSTKPIHAFVVVQVGTPIIVQKTDK
ncbi:predicted protein [Naegleria gruberi]|uniref:Predicted protein n=1 Tax=Naegleria gruberi TaxID=5762 RepID=D2V469_NAEGR|nr:uncharacterized protein NAEGRDRAFT_63616 [Naegleria gruberi]EFC48467.1 predicted protein [Naegleria gruberi]|eukprot:XP_002681211.1 predicted protein [Naegleria gruberi strain NEG-M]